MPTWNMGSYSFPSKDQPRLIFPYAPSLSLLHPNPRVVDGQNILMSEEGQWVRRKGFAEYGLLTPDGLFANPVQQIYGWRKWGGQFIIMLSTSTGQVLYKRIGTNANFVGLITGGSTPFSFVNANNQIFFSNDSAALKWDGVAASSTVWGLPEPLNPPSVSLIAGSLTGAYIYAYAWGSSTSGHVGPISLESAVVNPAAQGVRVQGVGTAAIGIDANQVHIYRTKAGEAVLYEHPNSPIADPGVGVTWTFDDTTTPDNQLGPDLAPLPGMNNAAPAMHGLVYYAGRIWGFKNNVVYYSANEEIPVGFPGVPEESFPTGNEYRFTDEVTGLGVLPDMLLVFTASSIYRITGDSLTTFARNKLAAHAGTRNYRTICNTGRLIAWLDTIGEVRMTDGSVIEDLSPGIQTMLENIDHSQTSMTFYDNGRQHLLLLLDGANDRIFPYDVNLDMWLPPWTVTGASQSIAQIEVAAADYRLMMPVRLSGWLADRIMAQSRGESYLDAGSAYTASMSLWPFDLARDGNTGTVGIISITRDANGIQDLKYIVDEDYRTGQWESIIRNEAPATYRTVGVSLVEKWYWARKPAGRRCGIRIDWPATNTPLSLYGFAILPEQHP